MTNSFYNGDNDTPPIWMTMGFVPELKLLDWFEGKAFNQEDYYYRDNAIVHAVEVAVPVEYCPFCGQPVPEIERIKVDVPICKVDESGDYCATCGERLRGCECYSPTWQWRPIRNE